MIAGGFSGRNPRFTLLDPPWIHAGLAALWKFTASESRDIHPRPR
jgi:hypothetical protein